MVSSGQETLLWIGFAGMTLGAIAIGVTGRRLRPEDRHHPVASLFVCLIAACSYFAMANSQGVVETGGRTVFYARYVDWVFTTPLLLLGLLMIALPPLMRDRGEDSRDRTALIAGTLGADVLMIVTGVIAALSTDDTVKYVWFTISCGFFLAVLGLIFGPVRAAARAQGGGIEALFGRLVGVLAALWLIYPVLWLLGTEGTATISQSSEVLVFTIIDLSAKVGFGMLLVLGVIGLESRARPVRGESTVGAAAGTA